MKDKRGALLKLMSATIKTKLTSMGIKYKR